MFFLTFVDQTTGKEYRKMLVDRVLSSEEFLDSKVEALKADVATAAVTSEWRKKHEYQHNGTISDVWKDVEDMHRWQAEVEERAKHIILKENKKDLLGN